MINTSVRTLHGGTAFLDEPLSIRRLSLPVGRFWSSTPSTSYVSNSSAIVEV